MDAGLKSAYFIELLYKSRQELKYILNITPDLHKIQPLQDLLTGVFLQISGLLGVVHSFLAVVPGKPAGTGGRSGTRRRLPGGPGG